MKQIDFWINIIANFLTIIASSIAIYIFSFNREKIKSAINLILNYSIQLTLTDIKFKIERLNDFTANDSSQKKEIINVLHEIQGQINGNKLLKERLHHQQVKLNDLLSNPKKITEPKKRSFVSELRESIRNIDVSNYKDLIS